MPTHTALRPRHLLAGLALIGSLTVITACGSADDDATGDDATGDGTPGGVVTAAGDVDDERVEADPEAQARAAVADAADADLDEDTLTDYLALITQMRAAGDDMAEQLGADPSQLASGSAALEYNSQWLDALDEHGFDQQSFTQVHTAVTLAFGAIITEQQMEQAEATLPPQQYEMMKQMMGGASSPFGAVSDEHKQLVKGMLAEVKAAFGYEGP